MPPTFDYSKVDLYDVLDVTIEADEKTIVKAYRKKALKFHPDKNPDASAKEIFHKISVALEVLTDAAARAAYDKVLKARAAAQVRHKQLDAKRQKLKEDLEAREQAGLSEQQRKAQEAKNLEAEIARLRKEGSTLLAREQELLKEELKRQAKEQEESASKLVNQTTTEACRIKLKWKCSKLDGSNGGYTSENLEVIFGKYGQVSTVLISSKKNGSAVIEFESPSIKMIDMENEKGLESCPLKVSWISGKSSIPSYDDQKTASESINKPVSTSTFPTSENHGPVLSSDRDFEDLVMMRMRQAEERKRLIAQLQQEDAEEEERLKQSK